MRGTEKRVNVNNQKRVSNQPVFSSLQAVWAISGIKEILSKNDKNVSVDSRCSRGFAMAWPTQ